jgi:sugar/nucleoside kinase (ribokinase family)
VPPGPIGGSGFAVAFAASALLDRGVGLVTQVGEDEGLYRGRPQPSAPTLLKHGAAGAEFLADGTRHRVAAPPADEVDSIVAGEILAGAFLALRALGLAEDRALRYAVGVATRSVTEFGVAGPAVTGELRRVRAELGSAF